MRADAQRNREKVLTAASERFAADGQNASLEAIAKDAGVGVGTLYRHFPTREALVEAAYRTEVEALRTAATQLLADGPPIDALEGWMRRFLVYASEKRALKQTLQAMALEPSPFTATRAIMTESVQRILDAGQADGSIRADVDGEDVLRATSGLWALAGEEGFEPKADRLIAVLVDGFRTR